MGQIQSDMDQYFIQLEEAKPELAAWKNAMRLCWEAFLLDKTEDNWKGVLQHLQDEYAGSAINTDGTFYKLHKIITIVDAEKHFGLPLFLNNCHSLSETIDKYQMLIMMIRRIDLNLEDELQDEAIAWIANQKITGIAIANIINKELLGDKDRLYQTFDVYMDCISDNFGKQLLAAYKDKE